MGGRPRRFLSRSFSRSRRSFSLSWSRERDRGLMRLLRFRERLLERLRTPPRSRDLDRDRLDLLPPWRPPLRARLLRDPDRLLRLSRSLSFVANEL